MSYRFLISIGALLAIALPAAAQAPSSAAKPAAKTNQTGTLPRTPEGVPDLQGVWLSNSATPLERPKELAGRLRLTDAEVAELKKRADRLFKNGNSDYASGDNAFLAALANPEHYKSATATGGSEAMVEREFDNRTSLIVDPPDGKIPALTPAAQRRQTEAGRRPPAGPEELNGVMRCTTYGVPRLGGNYGAGPLSYYLILQTPGYVVLFMEAIHEARVIPLDGRPHLPQNIRQLNGDSRGRWEGKTLVVDTTNFSSESNFMGSAENLHLVERFTRVARDTINYEITLDDPTTWTKSWTAMLPLKQSHDPIYEFACHEGNYATMLGILGAARADENAAEEAAAKNK